MLRRNGYLTKISSSISSHRSISSMPFPAHSQHLLRVSGLSRSMHIGITGSRTTDFRRSYHSLCNANINGYHPPRSVIMANGSGHDDNYPHPSSSSSSSDRRRQSGNSVDQNIHSTSHISNEQNPTIRRSNGGVVVDDEDETLITVKKPIDFLSAALSAKPKSTNEKSSETTKTKSKSEKRGNTTNLPFDAKSSKWLSGIGNTPLVEIDDGVFIKLEGANFSGSIKDRAISATVLSMYERGELSVTSSDVCRKDTLVLVTSGSAGVSLAMVQQALQDGFDVDLNCIVAIPKAYESKPAVQKMMKMENVTVQNGLDKINEPVKTGVRLVLIEKVFMEVLADLTEVCKLNEWPMLEQHYDIAGLYAHKSTAMEILKQCPYVTDVVCSTGTGATAAGLREFLPNHIAVHARPSQSGAIDGLSDVNRYDNFCNTDDLDGYGEGLFCREKSLVHQRYLREHFAINAGLSTGATHWLAMELRREKPNAVIVFISADGSCDDYPAAAVAGMNAPCVYEYTRLAMEEKNSDDKHSQHSGATVNGLSSSSSSSSSSSVSQGSSSSANHPGNVGIPLNVQQSDYLIIGGGPVGSSAAMFISEHESENGGGKSVTLLHDSRDRGAHEDWSRLARLSFDGPLEEFEMSKRAIEYLDMADEIRAQKSGNPVIALKPGMVFVASPGTNLNRACSHGESEFGDEEFVRCSPNDLNEMFPGNDFSGLPSDTVCWAHPIGYCVRPMELADTMRGLAEAYGTKVINGRVKFVNGSGPAYQVIMNDDDGSSDSSDVIYESKNLFVFCGAQSKELLLKHSSPNVSHSMQELEHTYITGISTIRYTHANKPTEHDNDDDDDSGHHKTVVSQPIVLGQLNVPDILDFQANFSVVPEEYGDVLKCRLSGSIGSETVERTSDLYRDEMKLKDGMMAELYGQFFGSMFGHLECEKPLDFNRCCTYRSHFAQFAGGNQLLYHKEGGKLLMTTAGCYGVGVKFGMPLGNGVSEFVRGDSSEGIFFHEAGSAMAKSLSADGDPDQYQHLERAW